MSVRSALLLIALAGLGGCEDPAVERIDPIAKPEPAAKPELDAPPTPEPAPVAELVPEPEPTEPEPAPEPEPVPKPKPAKKRSPGPAQSVHYIDCVRSCTKTNPIAEFSEAEARLDCEASCDPN